MKKIYILLCLGIFFLVTPTYAQEVDEKILEFKSDISINEDSTINIVETIVFQPSTITPRHGLEWQLPYIYSVKAFRRNTKLDIQKVTYYPLFDQELKSIDVYSRTDENGWAILRIGDANTYIEGPHVYIIEYTLTYTGITFAEGYDEVYLNIIGPGWNIPIESASAIVRSPGEIIDTICFTGPDGSTLQDCTISKESEKVINIKPNGVLEPYNGYTFAIKVRKGVIADTTKEQTIMAIIANIGILLPIPVGIYLFGFMKKKYSNKKITIIPNYEPEKDMDILLSGALLSPVFKTKYITASFIELATNGYLKIREYEKKKYEFVKRDKDGSDLPVHLKSLFDAIFAHGDVVPISKLTNFYAAANTVYNQAYQLLKEKDLLSANKIGKKSMYFVSSFFLVFGGLAVSGYFAQISAIGWILGLIVSGILIFAFAFTVDIRSVTGNEKYYNLLGLKMYINTAEKHRIEFHNDPKKYNEIFEKLLPYAMIFGLEKKWAKQFEDIYTQTPDWYEGNFNTFNAYYLANSLNSFNSTVAKSSTPPSNYSSGGGYRSGGWSSGGSGFSGGSSGGGGGGSGGGGW